jgi:apolipoprotein N-acyltransferase
MRNYSRYALAITSGVIISSAFAPWSLWWAAPLGIALLCEQCNNDPRRALRYTFIAALTLQIIHLHWTSIYVGSIPWLLLAVCEALFFTLPFLLWKGQSKIGFLAAWLSGEWLIARVPYEGFGWSRVGFIGSGPTLNFAYWGGPTLIAAANVIMALLLQKMYAEWRLGERIQSSVGAILLLALVFTGSALPTSPIKSEKQITISGVQGNVPRLGLDFNAQRQAVLQNHIDLTLSSAELRKSDLVVWPENASDVDPLIQPARSLIEESSRAVGRPILLGGVSRSAGKGLRNISLLVTPEGGIDPSSIYTKRHLAPFGEYLPLRSIAEAITPSATRIEDMTPGKGEILYRVRNVAISPVICFEVLDDQLLTEKSKEAELFAVLTNSATFGTTPQSLQQLAISRVRSIEHGRAIISISTSGVSALIDPRGKITSQTKVFHSDVITQTLGAQSRISPSDAIPGGSSNAITGMTILLVLLFQLRRRFSSEGRI